MTATETGAEGQAPAALLSESMSTGKRLRAILGGSSGNLVEWYDWFVYSAFAVYFSNHFFPGDDDLAGLLKTMAVFAVGFFARPLGAWLMGLYADHAGRKTALTAAVSLMCGGSLIIAVLPSYETIGVAAPILLVVARILQGLSVGGEYGASATYLSEMAGRDRRGFFSSFQYVTLISGQLLALCVLLVLQSVLPAADLEAWGWRIPFGIGGALAIAVFYIRRGLVETESFQNVRATASLGSSGWILFRHYPRQAFLVIALTAGGTLAFYAYSTYMQKFLVNTSGFSREAATEITAAALFVFMLIQPLAGWLSDRIGRKPLLIAFGTLGALGTYPIFRLLEQADNSFTAFLLVLAALLIVTGYTAINAVVKAELFPAHIRALGVALPYALANAVFGGTAEYVALWFKSVGLERGFYWYVTGMIALSLFAYLRMPETRRTSEIAED